MKNLFVVWIEMKVFRMADVKKIEEIIAW